MRRESGSSRSRCCIRSRAAWWPRSPAYPTGRPPAAEGEYYHADLVGLAAELADGRAFGRVRAVENYGAGDLLAIDRPDGPPVSLPFTDRVVPVVDLTGRRIVVDPPAGLLDVARAQERQ